MRGPIGSLLIATVLLLALLPPGTAGGGPPDPPDHPYKFLWTAPSGFTGSLLVEIEVDWGEDNECLVYVGAAGRGPTGLHTLRLYDPGGWGAGSGGDTLTYAVQAHVEDVADTRDITDSEGGGWGSQSSRWGSGFNGAATYTFAAFHVQEMTFGNEIRPPFELELACAEPWNVTALAGSDHVIGFNQATMEGNGASVNTIFGPEASVNVADGHGATFDTEEVRFAIRGFQGAGAAAGTVDLQHPDGETQYVTNTLSTDVDFRGPGGAYDFRVTRAGAALSDAFVGFLGGLDPVQSLDQIVA